MGGSTEEDLRVGQAVWQQVDGPLPSLGREEHRRLGYLTSTAGVSWETLGHQILPGHPKVYRILNMDLPVCVALWHAAAYSDLQEDMEIRDGLRHTASTHTLRLRIPAE